MMARRVLVGRLLLVFPLYRALTVVSSIIHRVVYLAMGHSSLIITRCGVDL